MSRRPLPAGVAPDAYRTAYLKLKTVLFDRGTELPAYPVLFDDLRTLLDDRRAIGVLLLEIDDLDTVESIYGWQTFDRIVARAAAALGALVGPVLPAGTLLALDRVAGARFLAFVPDGPGGGEVEQADLAGLGDRAASELSRAFDDPAFAGLSPPLSFRAGAALLSVNPFFRFERCVYAAIEQAARAHRERERRRERSWGDELREIIRAGSVELVFQPVVELAAGRVVGYEAFVRGPRDTLFEPPRAMFEMSGRIGATTDLDRMCCKAAVAAFGRLSDRAELKLFLNVLPETLEDDTWRRAVFAGWLAEAGLSPGQVVLDVSERSAHDGAVFVERLGRFRADGFGLAIDDIGTGSASREALEALAPDYLKLDVSIVRGIESNVIQQEVLQALVELADRIDAVVIAEGVEHVGEARTVRALGAPWAQGFLYAHPRPDPLREGERCGP